MVPLPTHALTRRRFLTAASTLAASTALSPLFGANPAAAATPDGEILSCSNFGAFWAKVEGGRVVKVRPWEGDPHPIATIEGAVDLAYSPSRIRYPMVRRAWLEKGPGAEPETRGRDDFVRVSWDKALDLVAAEIKRCAAIGPWSIYTGSYGWGHFGRLFNSQTALRRVFNLMGGSVGSTSNYSKAGLEAIMPYVLGQIDAEGPQTSHQTILDNTDLIVFWACDPLKDNHISTNVPDHGEYGWFEAMKKAGKKAIFIDPFKTEGCKILSGEWLPVRPHSDVALALGIAHVLITENLADKKFLADYTTGWEIFFDYVTGKKDGTAKTPEWAAEKTEIPAATIRDLAHRFVKGRTMLVSGWTPQRQQHGEQFPWVFVTLAAMVGQIGLPGGGFCQRYHLDNAGAPQADSPALSTTMQAGKRKETMPWPKEKGAETIPVARIVDMLMNPGKSYEHNGKTFIYPDVKMTYWVGGNPLHHHQDRNRQVAAWKKFETVIVQDFQWTASARFADIVLPAATGLEREDIEGLGVVTRKAYFAVRKVIEPLYESKSDYVIFQMLAEKLGIEPEFSEGKSELDRVKEVYAAALDQAKAKKIPMPDFDAFWKAGIVEFATPEKNLRRTKYAQFREDPLLNPLPTPSGKIEIFSKSIEKFGYDDCPPHPTWLEPVEWLGSKATKYPLHVNSSHPDYRLHSQLNGTKVRAIYAVAGREPCTINTRDAAARGIKTGDVVRVFNDRGQCLAGAVVSDDIRPGVIQLQEGGWYDPVKANEPNALCKYGDVNVLTLDIPTSRLAQATSAHTCMADVELFKGEAPKVSVFDTPKNG
ncbi:molybdopterin guanine dinucleotide-containing S/N-oxide reductase [Bradyrhizobium oligotrophicum]|uniref:molybdopterin guanine dinucleotide-containing S/N-oxide reductase n=1 Tax=Bradyrhizobium oligotrophicum TaxID=44255 RepID=UPI003EB767FF